MHIAVRGIKKSKNRVAFHQPISGVLKKEYHRHTQNFGNQLEKVCTNSVHAIFIFLNLLEYQAKLALRSDCERPSSIRRIINVLANLPIARKVSSW
jgi:hypothetical protein